ncbi:MAG: hypothetical protein JWR50_3489 [Mucilaginibacter sp.]|nr:hypothetical protein [Mucilaginibacter sp.]
MLTIRQTLALHTHPLSAYAAAFREYADIDHDEFEIRSYGEHALVHYQDEVYQVSHFHDIAKTCQSYFRHNDYGAVIYTAFPTELWTYFLKNKVNLHADDLIIELYQSCKHSWEGPVCQRDYPNDFREQYFEEFKQLAGELLNLSGPIVRKAIDLDDHELLPLVARAIKSLYKNEDDFFTDCASIMTHNFQECFGNGDVFEMINLNPYQYPPEDTYYIYSTSEDF